MTDVLVILKKLHYLMWANFRISFFFSFGLVMQFFNILIGACSYFFLTQLFPRGGSEALSAYGTNAVSYIIVGMALSPMLSLSANGFYSSLVNWSYNRTLERISMSRTSIFALLFSEMLSSFSANAITTFLYLLFGLLLFRIDIGGQNVPLALCVLAIGILATMGIGMILTVLFFWTSSGKVGANPFLLFFSALFLAFSGSMFPVEVLPGPIRMFSELIPQTHTLRAVRLLLQGGTFANNIILKDVTTILLIAAIAIPLGRAVLLRGIKRVKKEGYTPFNGAIWFFG